MSKIGAVGSTGREHTNREYEQELRRLREQILLMGAKVEIHTVRGLGYLLADVGGT